MLVRFLRLLCDFGFFVGIRDSSISDKLVELVWTRAPTNQLSVPIWCLAIARARTRTKLKCSYWVLNLLAADGIARCVCMCGMDCTWCFFFVPIFRFWMFIFVVWTNSYKSFARLVMISLLPQFVNRLYSNRFQYLRCMGNISARNDYTNYLRGHVS